MKSTDFPGLYMAADRRSGRAQQAFILALATNLSSLVLAALISAVGSDGKPFAIAQACLLLVGLSLSAYLALKEPQRIWYGARALAESVKTVTWRYIMRAEPYHVDDKAAQIDFVEVLKNIMRTNEEVSSISIVDGHVYSITPKMREIRALPLAERAVIYEKFRIIDQMKWYEEKSKSNQNLSTIWFSLLVLANLSALLIAVLKIEVPGLPNWPIDVSVTLAGAILAWLQAKRFQELTASYALAAYEISLIAAALPSKSDERSFAVHVADAENAFSREHTQWQARRDALS